MTGQQAHPLWTAVPVPTASGPIAAQVAGAADDPAVLLIGGATWSRDWWDDELCGLLTSVGLRVIRYDTRDTGESPLSPPGRPTYTADDLAEDARAVLDACGVERAVPIGLSMGAGTAQFLALRAPERVAGLVLIAGSPADGVDRGLPPPSEEVTATWTDPPADPDWSDVAAVTRWVIEAERPYAGPSSFDEHWVAEVVRRAWARTPSMESAYANHPLVTASAPRIDVASLAKIPTLVVHGSADPLFPLPHGSALADLLDAPLLVLDGAGHQAPPREHWPRLVAAIVDLIDHRTGLRV